jgi:calcium/calmodulin-dependent protein kinase (CaM kinase) II
MNSKEELLQVNQRLLNAIVTGDWPTYAELCASDLTAFEPEACGQLVEGLAFHRFYFDRTSRSHRRQATMASPRVRRLGDVAIVSYVRIDQIETEAGFQSQAFEETRIWHRTESGWKHVHFHRSEIR